MIEIFPNFCFQNILILAHVSGSGYFLTHSEVSPWPWMYGLNLFIYLFKTPAKVQTL